MSKLVAIPYYIDGPRSVINAANEFNALDKSSKIFSSRKGMGSFIKSVIGHDFCIKLLKEQDGFITANQICENSEATESFRFHIKITDKGCNKPVNAVLLVIEGEGLMRPERLIAFDSLRATTPTYLNIDIGYNKLTALAKEHLGIKL